MAGGRTDDLSFRRRRGVVTSFRFFPVTKHLWELVKRRSLRPTLREDPAAAAAGHATSFFERLSAAASYASSSAINETPPQHSRQ